MDVGGVSRGTGIILLRLLRERGHYFYVPQPEVLTNTLAQLRARLAVVRHKIAIVENGIEFQRHPSDLDLERYHLGMVAGQGLESLERHLLTCWECVDRAEESARYVDAIRSAACWD